MGSLLQHLTTHGKEWGLAKSRRQTSLAVTHHPRDLVIPSVAGATATAESRNLLFACATNDRRVDNDRKGHDFSRAVYASKG